MREKIENSRREYHEPYSGERCPCPKCGGKGHQAGWGCDYCTGEAWVTPARAQQSAPE